MNGIILRTLLVLFLGLQLDFCYASQNDVPPVQKSKNAIYLRDERLKNPLKYRAYNHKHHQKMKNAFLMTEEQVALLSSEDQVKILKLKERYKNFQARIAKSYATYKAKTIASQSSMESGLLLLNQVCKNLKTSSQEMTNNSNLSTTKKRGPYKKRVPLEKVDQNINVSLSDDLSPDLELLAHIATSRSISSSRVEYGNVQAPESR